MGGDLDAANTQLKLMNEEADNIRNTFSNLADTIKNAVNDLKGQNAEINNINSSYNKLENTARKLQQHREDENVLTVKQLKNLHAQSKEEVAKLKNAKQSLETKSKLTKKEKAYLDEVNAALADEESYLNEIVKLTSEEVKKEKELQKTLGITGQLFKGIAGTLSKIGIESDAIEGISKSMRDAAKTGSGFKVIGAAVGGIYSTLKDSLLNDPAVQLAVLGKVFSTLWNIGTSASQQTAEIARNLGISTANAKRFNDQMRDMAMNSRESAQTMSRMRESNAQLNEALGTSVVYSQEQLDTQTALVHRAGLQAEEAAKIAEFSILTGQSQEGIYDTIGGINKGVLSNKKVLQETLKVSGALRANYGNQPQALARAVIQAQKLGMTLEQTKNSTRGLLDFESSISAEMEAELLTGKDLNFEEARRLALNGKSAEAAALIRKEVGGLAEFQKMNVVQQEAIAKAAGMTADELADSLRKEQELEKLAKSKNITVAEAVKLQEQQQSASESMSTSIQRIKDSFTSLIAGPLDSITTKIASLFEMISNSPAAKMLLKYAGGIGAVVAAVGSLMLVGRSIVNTFKGKRGESPGRPTYVMDVGGGGGGGGGIDIGVGGRGRGRGFGGGLGGRKFFGKGGYAKDLLKGGRAGKVSRARTLRGIGGMAKSAVGMGGTAAVSTATKAAGKTAAKTAGKAAAKGAGKSLLKKVPVLGALAGIGFAIQRASEGDWTGAGLEAASGLASTIPGIGTAASLGLDAAIAARDMSNPEPMMATGGIVNKPTRAIIGEAGPEAVIPLDKLYAKFDELISVIQTGGHVYLDGNKVGTAMSVSNYKIQ